MTSTTLHLDLTRAESQPTAARSGLYSLLAWALVVPDHNTYTAFADGRLAKEAGELVAGLPYPLPALALPSELPPFPQFQSEYIAAFEVGLKGPPCPLYEGAFRVDRGRKAIMEEVLRFYRFFDLKMSESVRELPDQLSAQLEFMHYLAFLEAGLIERDGPDHPSRGDLRRGQRDFLHRHLCAWAPQLAAKAQKHHAPAGYCALLEFLDNLIKMDREYLERELASRSD